MRSRLAIRIFAAGVVVVAVSAPAFGQQRRFTSADYDRAVRLLQPNTAPLIARSSISATWLPSDRFWYRVRTRSGSEVVLVDPATRTRTVCDATHSNCPDVPRNADSSAAGGR